jgi:hypothetical protein
MCASIWLLQTDTQPMCHLDDNNCFHLCLISCILLAVCEATKCIRRDSVAARACCSYQPPRLAMEAGGEVLPAPAAASSAAARSGLRC